MMTTMYFTSNDELANDDAGGIDGGTLVAQWLSFCQTNHNELLSQIRTQQSTIWASLFCYTAI